MVNIAGVPDQAVSSHGTSDALPVGAHMQSIDF